MQEIAGAIVAMHDGDLLRRRRRIAAQPADRGAHDRLRLALVASITACHSSQRRAPAIFRRWAPSKIAQAAAPPDRAARCGRGSRRIARRSRAMRAIGIEVHHRRHQAAVDPAHDEERPLQRAAFGVQRERLGHRHRCRGRIIGAEFDVPLGLDQAAGGSRRRISRAFSPSIVGVEAIGLAAGAAGNAREIVHCDSAFHSFARCCSSRSPRASAAARIHGAKSSVA